MPISTLYIVWPPLRSDIGLDPTLLSQLDTAKLPQHLAIVMDGNGRWAQRRSLPRNYGHRAGVKSVDDIVSTDFTPTNDGVLIRLVIPPLTAERRKELVKRVKKTGEETKIALRNVRREGNETLKTLEKDKLVSEDDWRRGQDQVQKVTDRYIAKADEILHAKEHEVMEV